MGLIGRFRHLLIKGNSPGESEEKYLVLVAKEPENAGAHMKLAEIYQKKREKQKAIAEYLLAAGILAKSKSYDRAIAVYKKIYRQDPSLEQVHLKMADIYREMGFFADAFAQYRILAQHYESSGMKDKVSEITKLIAEMEPLKIDSEVSFDNVTPPKEEEGAPRLEKATAKGFFDLGAELRIDKPVQMGAFQEVSTSERVYGVKEILKELEEIGGPSIVDPHFNYTMGVAYRELGLSDEAIEQFKIAVKKRQKLFDALSMLGFCYKEKDMSDESQRSFEKALRVDGTTQEKKINVKYILGFLYEEQGRIEDALKLLQEIAAAGKGFEEAQKVPI
jgi:tetratricopeptide (TPR) repeat protein